jgi:hypothetical protein
MSGLVHVALRPGAAVAHASFWRLYGRRALGIAGALLFTASLLCATPAVGGTLTALSCSHADVNASVSAAASGDTVVVPTGNCSWTSGLTISKSITLAGAGVGRTVITDNYTGGSLITVTESTSGTIRITGFDFVSGTGPANANPDFFIYARYAVGGRPVLITGNRFNVSTSRNALGFGTNRGVIWSNTFVGDITGTLYLNNASCLRHKPRGLDTSWTTRATWGAGDTAGDQHLYFEANTILNVFECVDLDDNARAVLRYNNVTNANFGSHGTDTSPVGGRYFEIYRNTFTYDTTPHPGQYGDQPANVASFTSSRGGSAVIWGNTYGNIRSQAWGDKAEIQFAAENARRNQGPYPCWKGGYPIPHQVGWGYVSGSTQAGSSGVYQDLEPIYIWSNTGTGSSVPSLIEHADQCGGGASVTTFIQRGRDYYVDTPKPGYTPYVYPHPLAGGGATLPPPSNLQIR